MSLRIDKSLAQPALTPTSIVDQRSIAPTAIPTLKNYVAPKTPLPRWDNLQPQISITAAPLLDALNKEIIPRLRDQSDIRKEKEAKAAYSAGLSGDVQNANPYASDHEKQAYQQAISKISASNIENKFITTLTNKSNSVSYRNNVDLFDDDLELYLDQIDSDDTIGIDEKIKLKESARGHVAGYKERTTAQVAKDRNATILAEYDASIKENIANYIWSVKDGREDVELLNVIGEQISHIKDISGPGAEKTATLLKDKLENAIIFKGFSDAMSDGTAAGAAFIDQFAREGYSVQTPTGQTVNIRLGSNQHSAVMKEMETMLSNNKAEIELIQKETWDLLERRNDALLSGHPIDLSKVNEEIGIKRRYMTKDQMEYDSMSRQIAERVGQDVAKYNSLSSMKDMNRVEAEVTYELNDRLANYDVTSQSGKKGYDLTVAYKTKALKKMNDRKEQLVKTPWKAAGISFDSLTAVSSSKVWKQLDEMTGTHVMMPKESVDQLKDLYDEDKLAALEQIQKLHAVHGSKMFDERIAPLISGDIDPLLVHGVMKGNYTSSEIMRTFDKINLGEQLYKDHPDINKNQKKNVTEELYAFVGHNEHLLNETTMSNIKNWATAEAWRNNEIDSVADYIEPAAKAVLFGQEGFEIDGQRVISGYAVDSEAVSNARLNMQANPEQYGLTTYDLTDSVIMNSAGIAYETVDGMGIKDIYNNNVAINMENGNVVGYGEGSTYERFSTVSYDSPHPTAFTPKYNVYNANDELVDSVDSDYKSELHAISIDYQKTGHITRPQWDMIESQLPGMEIDGEGRRYMRDKILYQLRKHDIMPELDNGQVMSPMDMIRNLTARLNATGTGKTPDGGPPLEYYGIRVYIPKKGPTYTSHTKSKRGHPLRRK